MSAHRARAFAHFPEPLLEPVRRRLPEILLFSVPPEGEPPQRGEGEILLTLPWGAANLRLLLARGVRWIHTFGTGVERFPFEVLGEGRTLTCARGASAVPIAEWVLAVMLAFEKRLPEAWVTEAPERWSEAPLGGLESKTLGLVGVGGIGRAVAVRALAFGMRVRAVRRRPLPPPLPEIEMASDLGDLLRSADHLVLAAPATGATQHLLGRDALAQVRRGVHLVNIARGALVDQDALREALDDGTVARASLDTVEPEPLPAGHWLYDHPGVRLSPHISWIAPGAMDVLLESFVANARRWLDGRPLEGVVDPREGY